MNHDLQLCTIRGGLEVRQLDAILSVSDRLTNFFSNIRNNYCRPFTKLHRTHTYRYSFLEAYPFPLLFSPLLLFLGSVRWFKQPVNRRRRV